MTAAFSRVGDVLCAQLQSSDLPAIYASLPKNAQGRVDLKQLLSASRALLTARGATFDVERQLEQLELYDLGHEAQIEVRGDTVASAAERGPVSEAGMALGSLTTPCSRLIAAYAHTNAERLR